MSILLRALGYSNEEMLAEFFEINTFHINPDEGVQLELVSERLRGETLNFDLADGDKVIVEAGKRITARHVKQLEASGIAALAVPDDYIVGRILSHDVVDALAGFHDDLVTVGQVEVQGLAAQTLGHASTHRKFSAI